MVVKTYTLEIGGVEREYLTCDYEDKLKKSTPSRFDAVIKYYGDLNYFDLVEIKCNGDVEWKGFLEDMDIDWKSSGGRKIKVGGRDNSIILWKKWCDNYVNMHEGTSGFFGRVNASELIQFLLRCPTSDLDPVLNPYNKSGWGIDAKNMQCFSTIANPYSSTNPDGRIETGDPNTCLLRKQGGYGWRNSGNPYNQKVTHVDAVISNDWDTTGASPYIDLDTRVKYISTSTVNDTAIFSFEDLSSLAPDATTISNAQLSIVWKPMVHVNWTLRARVSVYLSVNGGTDYTQIGYFDGKDGWLAPNAWRTYTWDIRYFVDTVAKADDLRIKFIYTGDNPMIAYITEAYVTYQYVNEGNQQIGDEFDIVFKEQEVVGLYMESRQDNSSFPVNYGLLDVKNSPQSYYSQYTQVDPNSHIDIPSLLLTHIDFDMYQNETAYVYRDFGVDNIIAYFDHYFTFKMVSPVLPTNGKFGLWSVSNNLGSLEDLEGAGSYNLSLYVYNDGGGAKIYLREVDNGTSYISSPSKEITGATGSYRIRMIRRDDEIIALIYNSSDDSLFDSLQLIMHTASQTYRYLISGLTSNTSNAWHTDVDFDQLMYETYTDMGFVNSNTYRDIIHSWNPRTMGHLRVRITDSASQPWAVSQVYVYKSEELNYRLMYEDGTEPSFALDQYILSVSLDDTYNVPIGPLNVGKARVMDAIKSIIESCNTSYIPFEYWMDMDGDNTIHTGQAKGTDKSATISFEKGTHLGELNITSTIADRVQRVQVIGKGSGKTQDDVSSDWVNNTGEMSNINTWFEDIVTEKTVINKEVANILANIHVNVNGGATESLEIIVNNDEEYDVNSYLSGDYVTVDGTSHRIFNIRKSISKNGAVITINLDSSREIPEEALKDLYNKIKQITIQGVVAADWGASALNQKATDADSVLSTLFSSQAKNSEIKIPESITDPEWTYSIAPLTYTPASNHTGGASTGEHYLWQYGTQWNKSSDWMRITGPTDLANAIREISGVLLLNDVYSKSHFLSLTKNPKFTATVKCYKKATGVNPYDWRDGDYMDIGMYDSLINMGFMVRFIREDGIINAYARYNITGASDGWTMKLLRSIEISEGFFTGSSTTADYFTDFRYKVEIITEKDVKRVSINLYDVSPDNPIVETYPITIVIPNIDVDNITVEPLWLHMSANNNNSASNLLTFIMYNYKVEIEQVERNA
jgi:hypothetical protein